MGSNQNRHGDKIRGGHSEWGSKTRKEQSHLRKHTLDKWAIDDEVDPKPSTGSKRRKKDKGRWCKGKEGVEHHWFTLRKWDFSRFRTWKCQKCNRESWGRPKHGTFVNEKD